MLTGREDDHEPIAAGLMLLPLLALSQPAQAQLNPSRQITIVVPIGAGGGVDATGRLIAEKLQERLKQPVVVENRPAGGGMVGADSVAKAAPDGHTLLLMETSSVLHKWLHTNVPYDVVTDFAPIARVATSPMILFAQPVVSRQRRPRIDRARQGAARQALGRHARHRHAASSRHADAERAGQDRHRQRAVSRRGAGAERCARGPDPDRLGGADRGDAACRDRQGEDPGASPRRGAPASLPQVPTIAESGVPGFDLDIWFGVSAPAKTPPDVVARYAKEIAEIVALPDVKERIEKVGFELAYPDGETFRKQIRADHERFGKIIRDAGIKPN